jgi:NADPH2:quinone reductase
MPRAVVCREFGGQLELIDMPRLPAPGPGLVRVAVRAAGLNFPDTLMVAGKYQLKPPLPFSPGMESAGEVIEVGPGAGCWKPGDRVVVRQRYGAFAEEAVVEAGVLVALPDSFSFAEGACFHVAVATATHAVMQRGRIVPGETLLVHGAGGGVGLAAVEVGKLLGATVIAVAGGDDKLAAAQRRGADHLIDHRVDDFRSRVMELTSGRGADVVFDPVGGDVFDNSLRCTAWGGRILIVGFAGGRIQQIPGNQPLLKGVDIVGVQALTHLVRNPAGGAVYTDWMYARAAEGRLRPHLSATLPLERFSEALAMLSSRQAVGRIALTMGGGAS